MSEATEYATFCPVCGGEVFMETRSTIEDDVDVHYRCHSCHRIFSDM